MKNLKTRGSLIEDYSIKKIDSDTINLSIKIKDSNTYIYEICVDDRFPDIETIIEDINNQILFAKTNFKTFKIERYKDRDYIFVDCFTHNYTLQYTAKQIQSITSP